MHIPFRGRSRGLSGPAWPSCGFLSARLARSDSCAPLARQYCNDLLALRRAATPLRSAPAMFQRQPVLPTPGSAPRNRSALPAEVYSVRVRPDSATGVKRPPTSQHGLCLLEGSPAAVSSMGRASFRAGRFSGRPTPAPTCAGAWASITMPLVRPLGQRVVGSRRAIPRRRSVGPSHGPAVVGLRPVFASKNASGLQLGRSIFNSPRLLRPSCLNHTRVRIPARPPSMIGDPMWPDQQPRQFSDKRWSRSQTSPAG